MANARDLSILAQGASTAGVLSGGYGGTSLSSVGSAGNVLFTTNGTAWSSTAKIVQGTAVATSGTSVAFTNLPSWVKRITFQFTGISTNGASGSVIQLGTGGTPTWTTSGYIGATSASYNTTASNASVYASGIIISIGFNTNHTLSGSCVITNFSGNTWVASLSFGRSDTAGGMTGGGYITLSAPMTAIRIATINGTDVFDAGSVSILYE